MKPTPFKKIMVWGILSAFASLACLHGQVETVKSVYAPSGENFANPERGFFFQSSYNPREGVRPQPLNAVVLGRSRDSGVSLLRMYYVFSEFRDAPLSEWMLERISGDLKTVRAAGMKMIPRFTYNFGPIGAPDAPVERIIEHLDQLAPLLAANQDVLAFVEAGFIGTWGEWHNSSSGLFAPIPGVWWQKVNEKSRAVVDKLLAVVPPGRMIALRYPRHRWDLYGPDPLTESEAYTGTPKARMGAHNDCFLSNRADSGTYTSQIDNEKQFYRENNLFVPQGGETCNAKEEAKPFISCANALLQLEELHFHTLNIGYQADVVKSWRDEGCMGDIERRLGFRFRLTDSEAPVAAVRGAELNLSLTMANDGFANAYNQRPVEVVLRPVSGEAPLRFAVTEDPRRWMTMRQTAVKLTVLIPETAPPGEYEVLLFLPDQDSTLRERPEYAIRLANEGVWEPGTGMNRLAHVLRIE